MTSESMISQIIENTEMGVTIDVDYTPDDAPTETNFAQPTVFCAAPNSKKPPFPGDFIENRNGQACVTKIQQEIFNEAEDILASTTIRNSWIERKVNNEWFSNIGILQE